MLLQIGVKDLTVRETINTVNAQRNALTTGMIEEVSVMDSVPLQGSGFLDEINWELKIKDFQLKS